MNIDDISYYNNTFFYYLRIYLNKVKNIRDISTNIDEFAGGKRDESPPPQ